MKTNKKITLKIGYKEYVMSFVKKIDGGKTSGDSDGDKGRIRISKGMNGDDTVNTIIHEVLHAIFYTHGTVLDDDTEEKVVLSLANGLTHFMKENPEIMFDMLEMVTSGDDDV